MPFGRGGGSANGREISAVNKELPCVFRGPEVGRRVLVVLEVAPRGLGSGGDSGGMRAESYEGALREPLGGVGADGARFFVRISSRSLGSS